MATSRTARTGTGKGTQSDSIWSEQELATLRLIDEHFRKDLATAESAAKAVQDLGEALLECRFEAHDEPPPLDRPWERETELLSEAAEALSKLAADRGAPPDPESSDEYLMVTYLLWKERIETGPESPRLMQLPWSQPSEPPRPSPGGGVDISGLTRNRRAVRDGLGKEAFKALLGYAMDSLRVIGAALEATPVISVRSISTAAIEVRELVGDRVTRDAVIRGRALVRLLEMVRAYGPEPLTWEEVANRWLLEGYGSGLPRPDTLSKYGRRIRLTLEHAALAHCWRYSSDSVAWVADEKQS